MFEKIGFLSVMSTCADHTGSCEPLSGRQLLASIRHLLGLVHMSQPNVEVLSAFVDRIDTSTDCVLTADDDYRICIRDYDGHHESGPAVRLKVEDDEEDASRGPWLAVCYWDTVEWVEHSHFPSVKAFNTVRDGIAKVPVDRLIDCVTLLMMVSDADFCNNPGACHEILENVLLGLDPPVLRAT